MKHAAQVVTALAIVMLAGLIQPPAAAQVTASSELSTKNVRKEESNLANVIADAIRDAANSDAAFVAASSFADQTIPRGNASVDEFLRALTFKKDSVVVVNLSGEKIKAALEHGLALYPQMNSALLQVSGITVTIDPKLDRDRRVTSVRIGGSALDEKKVYSVAMPSPLADGGLAYSRIWTKSDISKTKDPKITLDEAVSKYLKARSSVGGSGDERLVFKK